MPDNNGVQYTNPPQSRNEAILESMIAGTPYTAPPQSRIEDLLIQIKNQGIGGGGLTQDIKEALLDCFAHVAWATPNGQTYYDALEEALNGPPKELLSISAVKTKTTYYENEVFDTSDLTVTATFSNGEQEDVTRDCEINSGAIDTSVTGTQTLPIAFTYGGVTKTTSITITIEARPITVELTSISATKTQTVFDEGDTLTTNDITCVANFSDESSNEVNDYVIDTSQINMSAEGTYPLGISYTYNGITKTTTISITVAAAGQTPRGAIDLTFTQNKQLSRFDGTIKSKDNYACTEAYTDIYPNMTYTITSATTTGYSVDIVFYSSSNVYVGYVQTKNGVLNVPEGAAKLRIGCYPNANASHITLTES